MAILLTTIAVTAFAAGTSVNIQMLAGFLWQFAAGPAIGLAVGWGAVWLFNRLTPEDRGYYYVLFLGLVPITYGMADFVQASGMLAVFTAGYVMGNSSFVHKQGIRNFSEALSTIGNIGMFARSEEHTSELQSRGHLVCRLLLEKKKKQKENKGLLQS